MILQIYKLTILTQPIVPIVDDPYLINHAYCWWPLPHIKMNLT